MKLAELNIVGFKSFAKKTNVIFDDGMTAIVGPNGCGKSNIVDAIRWVMGEQRSSVLRGEKMENVIFAGSGSTKAVGMAEVSLRIENTKNLLPTEYSEVVVTRRLFRSGESQYLINGTQCRLKDIMDLFMDTGMTGQSYSVIELPAVERILNGQPEERRRIFEEAAGITKFKQRRKLTMRKLDATQKDLLRVEDIISEVEKNVRSLKRQVTKARRYQELSAEVREMEIILATHDYTFIQNELDPLETKHSLAVDDREKTVSELVQYDARYEEFKTKLITLEKQLSEIQTEYNGYNREIQKFEERVLVNGERIRSLQEMIARYASERENLVARLTELEQEFDEVSYETKRSRKELEQAKTEYESLNTYYQKIRKVFDEKRNLSKNLEAEILMITERLSKKMNEGERLRATEENLSQRLEQIKARVHEQTEVLRETNSKLHVIREEESRFSGILEQKTTEFNQLKKQAEEARATVDGLRKADMQDQNRIDMLENNVAMIRKILENYQDYPSGVRYLATLNSDNFISHGTVANILHVQQQHRVAISAALGEAATFLLVNDAQAAYHGISLLQQERKGIVSFMPIHDMEGITKPQPNFEDLGVIGWANSIVRVDEKFKPVMSALLGSYLVVQDLETANRIADQAKNAQVNIVTLNGEVVGHWGIIRGGSQNKRQSDFVGRQEELENLHKEITGIEQQIERRQATIEQRQADETLARTSIDVLEMEIEELEEQVSERRVEIGRLEYQEKTTKQEIDSQINEKQQLLDRVNQIGMNLKNQDSDTASMQKKRTELVEQAKKLEDELRNIEIETIEASEKVQAEQIKVTRLSSEFESAQRQSDSVRDQINANRNMINQRDEESTRAAGEVEELKDVNQEYTERTEELRVKLKAAKEKLDELRDEQYEINVQTDEHEKQIRTVRERGNVLSESVHKTELRISELRMHLESLKERIKKEYDHELVKGVTPEDFEIEPSRKRVDDIQERLRNMGPVNLLALKEYEQEQERLNFLTNQRNDLMRARENLEETIGVINDTARKRFLETFKEVQTNFSQVFKSFFHGGRANLVQHEGDDPLEADIDIYAAPGGKKPASLQLLSGGEKSLTAVSLLFAIYLVKPSPFCIFDEVDAPLDDKNVQRFADALKDFSKDTQFITVTHNKLTMKAADQLYGVTMEKEGVSKVVSVKFEAAEKYVE